MREQYEKGKLALDHRNYEYATEILTALLDQEPAFFECRQLLRITQHKKAEGSRGGLFKRSMSWASSSPLFAKGQLALRNQPLDALKIAEQILNSDPHSAQGLEILAKGSPKDEDYQIELGRAYSQAGQVEKAEQIFADLVRRHPGNARLSEELKNMSARKTLAEGGYDALADGKGSFRDILKDKDQAVALEQENRQYKDMDTTQRLIDEYEAQLVNEPKNLKLLRSIAELYTQRKEYDRALGAYNRIVATEGQADAGLQKAIAEVTVRKFDHAIAGLDAAAPDYAEQCARIKAERDDYMLKECRERAENYPNDLVIRFELGQLYFQAGKITEAIQEMQKAQNNPNKRIQALSCLGQCFARRNMNDLAAKKLEQAIAEKQVFDEEKMEITYALGSVLEKMGKKEEAIEQFKKIYEVDVGFKDVAAKVDAYYAGQ
jgi:tetratricopeptide (TPR) repeat protein